MKRLFYALLTTLMAVMMTLVSCSGDDDYENHSNLTCPDNHHSYLICPDNHHPHMIDLGLPSGTKWACCNVGADKPEAYGGYYAWGETEEKIVYNQVTYKYCTGEDTDGDGFYDKYIYYSDLVPDIATTQYDVAHVKWGGSWVMPSTSQFEELFHNTTWIETIWEGVYGLQFTSRNGDANAIFLPASGARGVGWYKDAGSYGYYWSSTQILSSRYFAYALFFCSDSKYLDDKNRDVGCTVRPVVKAE